MAALIVIGWYAIGFLAASHLIRRGHDRTVWTMAAALTGALVAVAALVLAAGRALRPRSSLVHTTPPEVALVVGADPAPAFAALSRLDPMPRSVTLVGLASHEATARWIDTGEIDELRPYLAAHRAWSPVPTTDAVVVGSPAALDEFGARIVVLPRDRTERSRRHDAWRVLATARTSNAPVLSPAIVAGRAAKRALTPANRKATA